MAKVKVMLYGHNYQIFEEILKPVIKFKEKVVSHEFVREVLKDGKKITIISGRQII